MSLIDFFLSEEVWRPVVGFENMYEVSSLGQVRSLDRLIGGVNKKGRRNMRGRVLTTRILTNGYLYAQLGTHGLYTVHSLVARAFIGERPPRNDVCHIDGCRANPCVWNLRYDTRANNNRDAVYHGHRKLTPDQVREIRALPAGYGSLSDVVKRYGISRTHACRIRARRRGGILHVPD